MPLLRALPSLLATALVGPVVGGPVLLEDGFEEPGAAGWEVSSSNTVATLKPAAPGQLSDHCAELHKPDSGGHVILQRTVAVPERHWVVLSLGLQTLELKPYAEYYIWYFQRNAAGEQLGAGQGLAFADGLARASGF
ncbi:MAG: hypothetical protein HUU35_11075, partial [Armatimonadetes bacterium]|nr:hypothetical protein [Armatimonadota bacterium]